MAFLLFSLHPLSVGARHENVANRDDVMACLSLLVDCHSNSFMLFAGGTHHNTRYKNRLGLYMFH